MKSFLINWKTTAGGMALILGGLATLLTTLTHSPTDVPSLQAAGTAIIGGVTLLFAKDGNVTGGSVGQPSTAQALVASNTQPSKAAPPPPDPAHPPVHP